MIYHYVKERVMKDNLAIFCSGLCLVHCFAGTILLVLGLSGTLLNWFEQEWIHQVLLIPVVILALLSLPHAYKTHGSFAPVILVTIGISAMLSSWYLPESFELWLVIPSALLIITAHGMNKWLLLNKRLSPMKMESH